MLDALTRILGAQKAIVYGRTLYANLPLTVKVHGTISRHDVLR